MNQKLFTWFAIFLFIICVCCSRESNNTPLQQKGKSQSSVLQLLQQIDSLNDLGEYNSVIVKDYITNAEMFCNAYPEDPLAAEFLYKAGLMAMTLAKATDSLEETELYSQKALTIFDNILMIYPDFNGVKNCILNKGVIYDDILHDYENAEIIYSEFIASYPTDTLAINLESYLKYLGKSPEEIIVMFGK